MRKLNLPQGKTTNNKVAIRLFSPPNSPTMNGSPPSPPTPAASPPKPVGQQQQPVFIQRKALHDDTLEQLMNPRRVKAQGLTENELEPALESPVVQAKQQYEREQAFVPEEGDDMIEEEDGGGGMPYFDPQYSAFQDNQSVPQEPVSAQETELQKIVEKARLLARITQLSQRGLKPDKLYTVQTSVYELKVAVAKLEVIDQRSRRIEQGRSALMLFAGAVERGCNTVDERKMLGSFELSMNGYTDHLFQELPQYDDCLERGIEELLGPAENRKWYHDLMLILGASMLNYSMTNRRSRKQAMQQTIDAVKNDPAFREAIKREILAEMRGEAPPPVDVPASLASPTSDRNVITMEGPKLTKQANGHPHGDISPRAGDTTNMLSELRTVKPKP